MKHERVVDAIDAALARFADRTAVIDNDRIITYRDLDGLSAAFCAQLLDKGVRPGERVLVSMPNGVDAMAVYFGLWRSGVVPVPINPALTPPEIAYIVDNARPRVCVASSEVIDAVRAATRAQANPIAVWFTDAESGGADVIPLVPPRTAPRPPSDFDCDDFAILYSSGTTGRPKGIVLDNHGPLFCGKAWCDRFVLTEGDVLFVGLPLSHAYGLVLLFLAPLLQGATIVISRGFSFPEVLDAIATHRVTVFPAVPPVFQAMADIGRTAHDLSSVRVMITGAAPFPAETAERLLPRFPNASLHDAFGITETSTLVSGGPITRPPRPGSVGMPIDGVDIRIVAGDRALPPGQTGEIWIKTPGLMKGYLDNEDATREVVDSEGWYRSGDVGHLDADGYLYITDRIKDVIIVGGLNVYPREIEEVLLRHPDVARAAALGFELPGGGEAPLAYVVAVPGRTVDEAGILSYLRDNLAAYKIPRRILVVDEIPVSPSGKIQRAKLRANQLSDPSTRHGAVPPRTELERALAAIWQELLGAASIGIHDDFFALGGDSMSAVRALHAAETVLGRLLTLSEFMKNPTIAGLVELAGAAMDSDSDPLAPPIGGGRSADARLLALQDASSLGFDGNVTGRAPLPLDPDRELVVVVTGATGFLGAHMIGEILARTRWNIVALVRAPDQRAAHRRLEEQLRAYSIAAPSPVMSRVTAVTGDLAAARLGLAPDTAARLAETVDAIFHFGAWVNHLYPYERLRASNVDGTKEVFRLAAHGRAKSVFLASSLSVTFSDESAELPPFERLGMGYIETKWVAERLVPLARAAGIPVVVLRPGLVTWHRHTGATNTSQFESMLLAACIEIGAIPDPATLSAWIPRIVAVDHLCASIMALATGEDYREQPYHLAGAAVNWPMIIDAIRARGHALRTSPYEAWLDELERRLAHSHSAHLVALRSLVEAQAQRLRQGDTWAPPADKTLEILARHDMQEADIDPDHVTALLSYLATRAASAAATPATHGAEPTSGRVLAGNADADHEPARAYELRAFGLSNLVETTRAVPRLGPHDVLLEMRAASLNFRDISMISGMYNPGQRLPLIPLCDGVGRVIGAGAAVTRVAVGDRVVGSFFQTWLSGPVPRDPAVLKDGSLGGPRDGTLTTHMRLHEDGVVKVPECLTDAEAATLPCAAVTAWNALVTHGNLAPGDTVVAQGTGGVSLFALQFAKILGCRVIMTSSSDAKLERARALGADETINYRTRPDWALDVRRLTGGQGASLVVEIGGSGTLSQSLRAVHPGGTISAIGAVAGIQGDVNLVPLLMQHVRLQGISVGSRADLEAVCRAIEHHRLRPVIDRVFSFAEARDAIQYASAGQHMGKVVIDLSGA